MTKAERHEIAVVTKLFMKDDCDEIREAYAALHGSLKGLRNYIRKECVEFWTNDNPYLIQPDMGLEWIRVGNNNICTDYVWCFIRDGLKFELERK